MKEDCGDLLFYVVIILLFILGLVVIVKCVDNKLDKECIARYGSSYHGSGGGYSSRICVDENGDAKYL